jgi:hypothetical protein
VRQTKSNIFSVLGLAIMAMAIPAVQGAQTGGDDAPGPTHATNRLIFRRFPSDPPPCVTGQPLRRPCSGRQSGGNDTHQQGNGGDPVVVVGGTTWPYNPPQNFGDDGPPNPNHNDSPNHNDPPNDNDGPKNTLVQFTPNIAATPEPTYVALTGIAFTGLAIFARKRRRNCN